MKIKPVGSKIMVKPLDQNQEKKEEMNKVGDIIVPSTVKEMSNELPKAEIIDWGSRVEPVDFKKGDIVLVAKYTGSEVRDDDKAKTQYLMIEVADIIAIESK